MDRRFSALHLIRMITAGCVVHVIWQVVVTREIFLRCVVRKSSLFYFLRPVITIWRWSTRAQSLLLHIVLKLRRGLLSIGQVDLAVHGCLGRLHLLGIDRPFVGSFCRRKFLLAGLLRTRRIQV